MSAHGPETASAMTERSLGAMPNLALRVPLLAWLAALVVCVVAYLALSVPGDWFPSATVRTWSPRDLAILKGTGGLADDALQLMGPDAEGQALVLAKGELKARDFAAIEWDATGAQSSTEYRLVWRSDYAPQKLISIPISVASHRLLPVNVKDEPGWLGTISYMGLLSRGPLPEPLEIRALNAKPMGVLGTLGDRVREWLQFERVSGTSINIVAGGSDVQSLPLPLLLGTAIVLAGGGLALWRRRSLKLSRTAVAGALAVMFIASWFVLDARWMWNLARQTREAANLYGNKDWRGKHLASDDGPLFAFIEKVRAQLPAEPARVIVAADANYFRGRAAYHLFPHRVYYDSTRNVLPVTQQLRSGDWIVVYQRRGIAYDAAAGLLRWDGGAPVKAQLKLVDRGAALFLVQ